jgi:hypothetical protein
MKIQEMIDIRAVVSWRASGGHETDRIMIGWDDPQANRYHIWLLRPKDGGQWAVEDNTIYKNPPLDAKDGHSEYLAGGGSRWVPADPRYFTTRKLRADAKAHWEAVGLVLERADVNKAFRDYDKAKADERARIEREKIEAEKNARLEKVAPKLLALVNDAITQVWALSGDDELSEYDKEWLARARAVIAEVEGRAE